MVEQEIKAAPFTETKIRVLELKNLAELGIDTSCDNLNLAADKFTLGVKKVGEESVFVGRLEHPLAGGHFAQLLNSVSPFRDQDLPGIIADINLPILAERDYKVGKDKTTSNGIWLHERHLQDPRVGPPYIRFAKDHVNSWLMALKPTNGSGVFERLQRFRFVNGKEDIRRELFSENGSFREPLKDSDAAGLTNYYDYIIYALEKYDYQKYMYFWDKGLLRTGSVQAFLNTLTRREQEEFAILYLDTMGQIIADLETHRIIRNKVDFLDRRVKVNFDDNSRDVVISDDAGTKVVVTPTGQSSGRFSWRAIKYQFPEGYGKSSLYPIIAWKKDGNGVRTFLTQQEAAPFVAELGLEEGEKGDVKLGEIAVAYFARDIIKTWPAKMRLKPLGEVKGGTDDFEQPMRGGQMPAWVAVEQHKAELLKSEASALALLEQYSSIQILLLHKRSSLKRKKRS